MNRIQYIVKYLFKTKLSEERLNIWWDVEASQKEKAENLNILFDLSR